MKEEIENNFWYYFIPMLIFTVPAVIIFTNIAVDIFFYLFNKIKNKL